MDMKLIGITGGVGSGKTEVLSYIKEHCRCRIILADEAAHAVKEPGQPCYDKLVELLSKEVLTESGQIDRQKMAAMIFRDAKLLAGVNAIIHPAVKTYILEEIEKEKNRGVCDAFFVEAALLIEEKYDEILDELWYIFTREDVRRERLKKSRNYSDEKITQILNSQLPEEEFRRHCQKVIDNSGLFSHTQEQLRKALTDSEIPVND